MDELLIEYGFIPAYIILILFIIFWFSIPFYLSECAKTRMLIDKIQKGETVIFSDLDKNISNLAGIEFAFGSLPNEKLAPHLFKNPTFRKHIVDLKKFQKFYLKAIIVMSILLFLLLAGTIYVAKLEKNKSESITKQTSAR